MNKSIQIGSLVISKYFKYYKFGIVVKINSKISRCKKHYEVLWEGKEHRVCMRYELSLISQ